MSFMDTRQVRRRALLLGAAAFAFAPSAWAAVKAPKIGYVRNIPEAPYNEAQNADAVVRAAAARAKAANKLLLIDMGGNWCPDCRILAGIMETPVAKTFLAKHYEVVLIDVGRMDKNLQIPARYGMGKIDGVPAVIVVNPAGKVLNAREPFVLSDARSMSTQAVLDKLASWVP